MNVFTGRSDGHCALGYGRMFYQIGGRLSATSATNPPAEGQLSMATVAFRPTPPGIPCRAHPRRKAQIPTDRGNPLSRRPFGHGSIALQRRPARVLARRRPSHWRVAPQTPERGPVSTTMTLYLTGTAAEPELLTLPWRLALESWPERVLVALPRGISRHRPVRPWQPRRTRDQGDVRAHRGSRVRAPVRVAAARGPSSNRSQSCRNGRRDDHPLLGALVTQHLTHSLPYRAVMSTGPWPQLWPSLSMRSYC